MTTRELFQQGKLEEAIAAQVAVVRSRPTDTGARCELVEYLCIAGQLERADAQLETIIAQSTAPLHGSALLRQLLRAELARRDFWSVGRLPEFVGPPSESLRLALEASIRLRERDFGQAVALLEQSAAARTPLRGQIDNRPFDDLVDMDDRLAGVLEALTPNGKYYWIELSSIVRVELEPLRAAIDLCWRPARVEVRDGPQGTVYLPTVYDPCEGLTDAHRLGRETDWLELSPAGPVRGRGQRMWLAGEEALPALEVRSIVAST